MTDLTRPPYVDSALHGPEALLGEYTVTVSTTCPDRLTVESAKALSRLLDKKELSRLRNLKNDDAWRQYLAAHALLRTALSSQHPVMPFEWRFSRTQTGQPMLIHPPAAKALFFSLSHTKGLAVCAVSATAKVGVDAERVDSTIELSQLAPHVFSPIEWKRWAQELPPLERVECFYKLWTLKEALLKATGRGLSVSPSCLSFHFPDGLPPHLAQLPPELGYCEDWSFRAVDFKDLHVCALAAHVPSGEPLRVSWRDYSIKELVNCACQAIPVMTAPCTASTADGRARKTS